MHKTRSERAASKARSAGNPRKNRRSPAETQRASPATEARPEPVWRDPRVRFVVVFALTAGCLFALYYAPSDGSEIRQRWTAGYLGLYTKMAASCLHVFDPGVSYHGNTISGRFSMQIVKGCDAMEANMLFVAAALAVPTAWRRKLLAFTLGFATLIAFNVFRLVVLYWVGAFAYSAFDFLHYDIFPLFLIVFATVDFVLCARWAQQTQADEITARPAAAHVSG